jgi:hypothetical protein
VVKLNISTDALVSSYEIRWKPQSSATWQYMSGAAFVAASYRIGNLTGNIVYDFGIRSRCVSDASFSAWSTQTFTTSATVLCAPFAASTGLVGATVVQLVWDTYSATEVYGYEVRWRVKGSTPWTLFQSSYFGTNTSHRIFGLAPSTVYEWQIRNVCAPGMEWNNWSAISEVTTNATATCAPLAASVGTLSATTAEIIWPEYTANTYGYEVRWRVKTTSPWTTYSSPYFVSVLKYRITGLTASTTYEWQLRSVCAPGGEWNNWSTIGEFSTPAPVATCAAFTASATVLGGTSARISWTSYTAGTNAYEIRWKEQGSLFWSNYAGVSAVTQRTLYDLTPSSTYEWQLRNACGAEFAWNAWSSVSTFTTTGGGRLAEKSLNISVYPNPSSGIVNVSGVETAMYYVYNALGQMVASGEISNENATLNLSNQTSGMYLLKVVSNGAVQTKQIIINR